MVNRKWNPHATVKLNAKSGYYWKRLTSHRDNIHCIVITSLSEERGRPLELLSLSMECHIQDNNKTIENEIPDVERESYVASVYHSVTC